MAWIERRVTRTSQPQEGVGFNPALGAPPSICLLGNSLDNLGAVGLSITKFGTAAPVVGQTGVGSTLSGAGSYLTMPSGSPVPGDISSGVVVFDAAASSATPYVTSFNTNASTPAGLRVEVGAVGTSATLAKHDVALIITSSNTIKSAGNVLAWSYNAATGVALLVLNGVLTTATSAQTLTHGTIAIGRYGSNYPAATASAAYDQYLLSVYPYERSAAELLEIGTNPWQLFDPIVESIWLPGAVSAGGTTTVTSDSGASFSIRTAISSDASAAYGIRASVSSDAAASYAIHTNAASDTSAAYSLRAAITSETSASYSILTAGAVTSDISAGYIIRGAVQSDASVAYELRGAVQSSLSAGYDALAAVPKDASASYALRSAVVSDLAASYTVLALTAVTADLVVSYAIDGAPSTLSPADVAAIAAAVRTQLTTELTSVTELAKLHGLLPGVDLVVTPTSRTAGDVVQAITTAGSTTTVSRAA